MPHEIDWKDIFRYKWWPLIVATAVLVGVGVGVGCEWCGSGAGPIKVIIIRPEPSNPANPASNHWTIDGAPAIPQPESDPKLNRVAFLHSTVFETIVVVNGVKVKVNPFRMTAVFSHCSVTTTSQCHDCPAGETCARSLLDLSTGALGSDFRWYLGGTELSARSYTSDQAWRADLCGDLEGPITVFWRDSDGTPHEDPVAAGEKVKIVAN